MSQLPYALVPPPGDLSDPVKLAAFVNRINSALQKVQQQVLVRMTPAASSTPGRAGTIAYDDNYIYVWTADANVKRAGLSSF